MKISIRKIGDGKFETGIILSDTELAMLSVELMRGLMARHHVDEGEVAEQVLMAYGSTREEKIAHRLHTSPVLFEVLEEMARLSESLKPKDSLKTYNDVVHDLKSERAHIDRMGGGHEG